MSTLLLYFSSFWGQMIWEIYLLFKFEIIGVFLNTLTADYTCEICIRALLSDFFIPPWGKGFGNIYLPKVWNQQWNLHQIWNIYKKRRLSSVVYFRNYRMSKTWIDHSLNSAVSQHPSTVNMLKGPKHLWNLQESTFIIFFYHFEGKWFVKYLL